MSYIWCWIGWAGNVDENCLVASYLSALVSGVETLGFGEPMPVYVSKERSLLCPRRRAFEL